MTFGITKDDLLRGKILKPGLYTLLIKNISQGPGKNDPQSTTTTIEFTTEDGPDLQAQNGVGVPIAYWLSEKAPGLAIGFLEAVIGKKIPDNGIQVPDLATCIGKKVKAYIKNEMYQNRPTNKIDGFIAL